MSFLVPEYDNLQSVLDAAKVADVILFVVGTSGMDSYGELCLTCILSQGIPALVFACQVSRDISSHFCMSCELFQLMLLFVS